MMNDQQRSSTTCVLLICWYVSSDSSGSHSYRDLKLPLKWLQHNLSYINTFLCKKLWPSLLTKMMNDHEGSSTICLDDLLVCKLWFIRKPILPNSYPSNDYNIKLSNISQMISTYNSTHLCKHCHVHANLLGKPTVSSMTHNTVP